MAEQITVRSDGGGGALACQVWAIGWLFTIGFLKLAFFKAVLALIAWPWFLGRFFSRS